MAENAFKGKRASNLRQHILLNFEITRHVECTNYQSSKYEYHYSKVCIAFTRNRYDCSEQLKLENELLYPIYTFRIFKYIFS